jgi:hypothetical protein
MRKKESFEVNSENVVADAKFEIEIRDEESEAR